MATTSIENWPLSTTHCQLKPPRARTVTNIRISLTQPQNRVSGEHFCRWQYGSIFIRFHIVVSGSARSRKISSNRR